MVSCQRGWYKSSPCVTQGLIMWLCGRFQMIHYVYWMGLFVYVDIKMYHTPVITAIGPLWQKLNMNTQRKQTAKHRYVCMHTHPSALPAVFCLALISCVCCSILPSVPTCPGVWGQTNPRSRYGYRLNSPISDDLWLTWSLLVALPFSCGSVCFALWSAETLLQISLEMPWYVVIF